jgi:ABC-type glycerol-3-phosphate transport system substrate-binding protein
MTNNDTPNLINLTVSVHPDTDPRIFERFEENHPGVVITLNTRTQGPLAGSLHNHSMEEHLNQARQYISSGDVVYVNTYNFTAEIVQSGYLLDLTPLSVADASQTINSFSPHMLESFQFNEQLWALPVAGQLRGLIYQPALFEENDTGLPAPNWSTDDFFSAVTALTQIDPTDEVTSPGILTGDDNWYLLRSLVDTPPVAAGTSLRPYLTSDKMIRVLEDWARLRQEAHIMQRFDFQSRDDFLQVPMQLAPPDRLNTVEINQEFAPLPNGYMILDTQGFAINSDTQHPEMAYELVKFLATDPESVEFFMQLGSTLPADTSLYDTVRSRYLPADFEPQAYLEQTLSAPDVSYLHYIDEAMQYMEESGYNARSALEEVQNTAITRIEALVRQREDAPVAVPTIAPTLAAGQIAFEFGGMDGFASMEEPAFQRVYQTFLEANPDIGGITFSSYHGEDFLNYYLNDTDCFVSNRNLVTQQPHYLPGLQAFSNNIDDNDYLPHIIDHLQHDATSYGFPLAIYPVVIFYDGDDFADREIEAPPQNWTLREFNQVTQTLQMTGTASEPVFVPHVISPGYIFMLAAAQDVLLYDYRTDPPRVSLEGEAQTAVLQSLVEQVEGGILHYENMQAGMRGPAIQDSSLRAEMWSFFEFRRFMTANQNADIMVDNPRLLSYPRSVQYAPVSYTLLSGYTGKNSRYGDACAAWFEHLSQHPYLFRAMPARADELENATIERLQGTETVQFYQTYADILSSSQYVFFPDYTMLSEDRIIEYRLLSHVFDNIFLEQADIQTELATTQNQIEAYRLCMDNVETETPVYEDRLSCLQKVAPDM